MLYPLKFDNIYIEKIWGGRDFELFRNNLPEGSIGETWDVSCYPDGISAIINGKYAGTDLKTLIETLQGQLVGDDMPTDTLPVMLRLVNPRDKLSIQVHPTDAYARSKGMESGKTEAWYVMETFENPFLYIGTQGCNEQEFKESIISGDVERYMKRYDVKKGDVFLLQSGAVHAMGSDLIVVEIGQNSNTTFRLFDYGRGREVDIEEALQVVDLHIPVGRSMGLKIECDGYSRTICFAHEAFAWEVYDIKNMMSARMDKSRFCIYTCVEGCGIIKYKNGKEYLKCAESVLMPAYLGEYEIQGKCKLLKSYVPDLKKLRQEIYGIAGLREA